MSMFHELMMKKKGMPSNYQEVEYIESTGTQYIDTGIKGNINTEFVCDVAFTDITSGRFGSLTELNGIFYRYYFGVVSSNFAGANSSTYNHSISIADTNRHIFKLNNNGLYIDNVLEYSNSGFYPSSDLINLYLFSVNDKGSAGFSSKAKLYSSQIYDNGTLVRNYIPVYDTETQKYGMWESVQGKFYGNAGTGDFRGSIVGYTVVGNPTITDGVVSGFSLSNYLEMQQNIKPTQSFEVKTKFNKTSDSPSNGIFSSRQSSSITSAGRFGIGLTCGNYVNFFVSFNGTSWGFDITDRSYFIENNISYFVKFGWTGKEYYVLISTDDINYVKIISHLSTTPPTSNIEYTTLGLYASTDRRFLSGNLYLNETYIKINNKLWFNGQQA